MRPRHVLAAVSLLVVAGALAPGLPGASAAPGRDFRFAHVHLPANGSYGEPSLAVSHRGRIVVCVPGGGGTKMWYSGDTGRTFTRTATTSPNGGGDCDVHFMPNGDVLNADLEVYGSNVKISHDGGRTFAPVDAPNNPKGEPGLVGTEQDRQWFASSPDGKDAYLVYHDFAAEAEFYAASHDGGRTWDYTQGANPITSTDQAAAPGIAGTPATGSPASLVDQGVNTFSGPMLVSPDGNEKYVLYSISDAQSNALSTNPGFGPTRGVVVAHQGPEGGAWTNRYAVVSQSGETNGAIFPWGAVDKAGNVYVFYNSDRGSPGHFHTYYVYSTDKARTWSSAVKVDGDPLPAGVNIYATGAAGADGVIDLAWYGSHAATSSADPKAIWDVQFAQVRGAHSAHPQVTRATLSDEPIHRGSICLDGLLCLTSHGDRSLLDFFELVIGPDGMAQVAYAANLTPHNGAKGEVVWARQVSGGSALATPTARPARHGKARHGKAQPKRRH